MIILLIVCIVYLGINYITADHMRQVSYLKGYDDNAHAFWMVFFLGIIGCLYVVALPDLNLRSQNEKILELLRNKDIAEDELPQL